MHSAVLCDSEIVRLHTEAAEARRKWEASAAALKKDLSALNEHNRNLKELWMDEQKRCVTLDEKISEWSLRCGEAETQIAEESDRNNVLAAELQLLEAQRESAMERNQVVFACVVGLRVQGPKLMTKERGRARACVAVFVHDVLAVCASRYLRRSWKRRTARS